MSILLVGAGAMGGALLRGWVAKHVAPAERMVVVDPSPSPAVLQLASEAGVALNPSDYGDRDYDAVVYAVKPHLLEETMRSGQPAPASAVRLSVAAGRTVASIAAAAPKGAPVVRAMPNLPVAIGEGVVGLFAAPEVGAPERAIAERLMEAVGAVVWTRTEEEIDALAAVSGSGPAYLFAFVEALAAAAVDRGFAPETAALLARKTVIGSAAMLAADPSAPEDLRSAVTSKGGSTAEGLRPLLDAASGLAALTKRAVAAAEARNKELAN
ncbi:MAG: pyrroline-5-carboxylate reductase [Pseudomonadota bacterium]